MKGFRIGFRISVPSFKEGREVLEGWEMNYKMNVEINEDEKVEIMKNARMKDK